MLMLRTTGAIALNIALTIALALALGACAGNGEGLNQNGRPIDSGPEPLTATFSSIQQNVFTPICTQCHTGSSAPLGLRLDADSSYEMLVNVPSVEVPSLRRVRPGNPDTSYLIQKIEGTAAIGGRMPLNGTPLPAETIAVIRQWILDGAQRPTSNSVSPKPATLLSITPSADAILESPPQQIILAADSDLDTTLIHRGTVALVRSGGDGSFDEGNEVALDSLDVAIRSTEPTVIAVSVQTSWIRDSYRLTVAGAAPVSVTDRSGRAIDGNADGQPGGDFVLYFDLAQ